MTSQESVVTSQRPVIAQQSEALAQLKRALNQLYPNVVVANGFTYNDVTSSTNDVTPFLDIWRPVSRTCPSQGLKFLPCFHVLVTISDEPGTGFHTQIGGKFKFSLVTFNGTVVDQHDLDMDTFHLLGQSDDFRIEMLSDLASDRMWYCSGIDSGSISGSLKNRRFGFNTIKQMFILEHVESVLRIRSGNCRTVVFKNTEIPPNGDNNFVLSCDECEKFNQNNNPVMTTSTGGDLKAPSADAFPDPFTLPLDDQGCLIPSSIVKVEQSDDSKDLEEHQLKNSTPDITASPDDHMEEDDELPLISGPTIIMTEDDESEPAEYFLVVEDPEIEPEVTAKEEEVSATNKKRKKKRGRPPIKPELKKPRRIPKELQKKRGPKKRTPRDRPKWTALLAYAGKKISLRQDIEYDVFEETSEGTKLLPRGLTSYTFKDEHTKLHYRCKVCMKTYSLLDYLAKCMVMHKENIDLNEAVSCPLCSQQISRRQDVNDHFLEKHADDKKHCCAKCLMVMGEAENTLRRHILRQHHAGQKKKFLCTDCGETFINGRSLRIHVARKHEQDAAHICQICGVGFRNLYQFRDHVKVKHDPKIYKCLHCDKAFSLEARMKHHLMYHTGYRPYKCAHCGNAYKKRWGLYLHVEKAHSKSHEKSDIIVLEDDERKMVAQATKELAVVMQNTKMREEQEQSLQSTTESI